MRKEIRKALIEVFSRDADAIIDIIELEADQNFINQHADKLGEKPFRVDVTVREFEDVEPFGIWFSHPIHRYDTEGALKRLFANGEAKPKSDNDDKETMDMKVAALEEDFEKYSMGSDSMALDAFLKATGKKEKTVRNHIKLSEKLYIDKSVIRRVQQDE